MLKHVKQKNLKINEYQKKKIIKYIKKLIKVYHKVNLKFHHLHINKKLEPNIKKN